MICSSFNNSIHSSVIASGLVARESPTTFGKFKIVKEVEPNKETLDISKNYRHKTIKGKIKTLYAHLQFISPTQYIITSPTTLTILEYKVNEISNKSFYIKEHKEKYGLKKIKQILTEISK